MKSFTPDFRPQTGREHKKEPAETSKKIQRQTLEKLRDQETEFAYVAPGRSAELNRERLYRIRQDIQRLEYASLPFSEQEKHLEAIRALQNDINSCVNNDQESIRVARLLISKRDSLLQALPEQQANDLKKTLEQSVPEQKSTFWEDYEATAKEAIHRGIHRLNATLEEILAHDKQLPTAIIYPETTSRPLRYAVKPLFEQKYAEHQEPQPKEFFFKTFSDHAKPDGRETLLLDQTKKVQDLQQKLRSIVQERQALLLELKKRLKDPQEQELMSKQAHELWQKTSTIKEKIQLETHTLNLLNEPARFTEASQARMAEILAQCGDGPILIVDDVLAHGRTITQIYQLLQNLNGEDRLYFFSFIGSTEAIRDDLTRFIDPSRISVGLAFETENIPQEILDQTGYILSRDGNNEGMPEAGDLFVGGFPFRMKHKQAATGVEKNQLSTNGLVTLSTKRDPAIMRAERQKYRAWGEIALQDLDTDTSKSDD